jgi:hypothetical protein
LIVPGKPYIGTVVDHVGLQSEESVLCVCIISHYVFNYNNADVQNEVRQDFSGVEYTRVT